jgi:DNA polymerase III alpha subunit
MVVKIPMTINNCGQVARTQAELCQLIRQDPSLNLNSVVCTDPDSHNRAIAELYSDLCQLAVPTECADPAALHQQLQSQWRMPAEYADFDVAQWLLAQCNGPDELQRMAQELFRYQDYDLLDLLKYLHYMVTVFRQHNIVMGVGRGSSVASFALYKLGVHQINSLYWDLDINEFLK